MFLLVYNSNIRYEEHPPCEIDRKIVIFFEFVAMNNYVIQHIQQKISNVKANRETTGLLEWVKMCNFGIIFADTLTKD